jgi:hypothetical protein
VSVASDPLVAASTSVPLLTNHVPATLVVKVMVFALALAAIKNNAAPTIRAT